MRPRRRRRMPDCPVELIVALSLRWGLEESFADGSLGLAWTHNVALFKRQIQAVSPWFSLRRSEGM